MLWRRLLRKQRMQSEAHRDFDVFGGDGGSVVLTRLRLASRVARDLEDNCIDPLLVVPDGLDDQL